MTSMEKLAPFFEAYSEKVKRRRNEIGMTVSTLSEKSGVPYSNVSRVNAGTQANPLLYNEAAIADTLGLSLDDLCGLDHAAGSPRELQDQIHKLKVENSSLAAANESQRTQIKSTHTICYILLFISALLAISLVAYLIIDAQIKNAGLIQGETLSVLAWAFIALIAAAVFFGGIAILHIIRRENREENTCRNV